MNDDTLGDILAGGTHDPARADLHAALDALMDAADADGGKLDATGYWAFVACLADGRGIADELANAAAMMVAEKNPAVAAAFAPAMARALAAKNPARGEVSEAAEAAMAVFQAVQFATLFHLIKRLDVVKGAILPKDFASAFLLVATNRVEPGVGIHIDMLGLGSTRAGDGAIRRAARQSLVCAVYFRAERDGILLTEARAAIFPPEGRGADFNRTWQGWQREVAQSRSLPIEQIGDDARRAARGIGDAQYYDLGADKVAEYWKLAWRPR